MRNPHLSIFVGRHLRFNRKVDRNLNLVSLSGHYHYYYYYYHFFPSYTIYVLGERIPIPLRKDLLVNLSKTYRGP